MSETPSLGGSQEQEQYQGKAYVRKQLEELSAQIPKTAEEAMANAQNRFGLSPEAYHRRVILMHGDPENSSRTQHFCAAHMSPPSSRPKRLVILFGGNNEPLTTAQERMSGSQLMPTYLLEQFAQENQQDVDVLHFKAGELAMMPGVPPDVSNAVALQHALNITGDAVSTAGIFSNRTYSEIRMFGFSYGAGANTILAKRLEELRKTNTTVPPITRSMSMDGVVFGSVGFPPTPETRGPGQFHMNVIQPTWAPLETNPSGIARGAEVVGARDNLSINQIQYKEATGRVIRHGALNETATKRRSVYSDPVTLRLAQGNYAFLNGNQLPSPAPPAPPLTPNQKSAFDKKLQESYFLPTSAPNPPPPQQQQKKQQSNG